MPFVALQKLGDIKFQKILNELMRGSTAMGLARTIQTEWGDFVGIPEKTLTQQLNRLRIAAAEGMYGPKVAKQLKEGATSPTLKSLEGVSTSVMERMEELAAIQRSRVIMLADHERVAFTKANTPPVVTFSKGKAVVQGPNGPVNLTATNQVIVEYSQLLQDMQKLRFDLGMDEFKGVIPGIKGAATSVTYPDGTNVQKQVYEATVTLEQILDRRNVPALPGR